MEKAHATLNFYRLHIAIKIIIKNDAMYFESVTRLNNSGNSIQIFPFLFLHLCFEIKAMQ
jgi:hypothetical protein